MTAYVTDEMIAVLVLIEYWHRRDAWARSEPRKIHVIQHWKWARREPTFEEVAHSMGYTM